MIFLKNPLYLLTSVKTLCISTDLRQHRLGQLSDQCCQILKITNSKLNTFQDLLNNMNKICKYDFKKNPLYLLTSVKTLCNSTDLRQHRLGQISDQCCQI